MAFSPLRVSYVLATRQITPFERSGGKKASPLFIATTREKITESVRMPQKTGFTFRRKKYHCSRLFFMVKYFISFMYNIYNIFLSQANKFAL